MQLAIINGSPRYKNSNSAILVQQFLKGFQSNSVTTLSYLSGAENRKKAVVRYFQNEIPDKRYDKWGWQNEIPYTFPSHSQT